MCFIGKGGCLTNHRTVVLTGSGGFIGRHYRARYGGLPLGDPAGRVDLLDSDRVRKAIESNKPDMLVHLAAQSSVAVSVQDPVETYRVNFLGTLNLLQALVETGFQGTFLFASSAEIYGRIPNEELPVRESRGTRPRSPYAVSKVAAEALCYQYSQLGHFRVVIVRPFNQLGPGHASKFAIPSFAKQIAEIKLGLRPASLVTGNLDVSRDFTDVRDSIRAINLLLDCGENGEAYNLCSGQERTIRSVILALLKSANIEAQLTVDPARLRVGEQQRLVGDNTKLVQQSGWNPEIPFSQTIDDLLNDVLAITEKQPNV